jgi:hypothetical protein
MPDVITIVHTPETAATDSPMFDRSSDVALETQSPMVAAKLHLTEQSEIEHHVAQGEFEYVEQALFVSAV